MTKDEAKKMVGDIYGPDAAGDDDIVDFYLRVNENEFDDLLADYQLKVSELESENAALRQQIALNERIINLQPADMTHQYNQAEAERVWPQIEQQIRDDERARVLAECYIVMGGLTPPTENPEKCP